jgi:hypothetical protein
LAKASARQRSNVKSVDPRPTRAVFLIGMLTGDL